VLAARVVVGDIGIHEVFKLLYCSDEQSQTECQQQNQPERRIGTYTENSMISTPMSTVFEAVRRNRARQDHARSPSG
jgi:hypothetical protein